MGKSWRFVRSMTRGNLLALKENSKAKLTDDQRVSLVYHIRVVQKAAREHKIGEKVEKKAPPKGKKASGKKPANKAKKAEPAPKSTGDKKKSKPKSKQKATGKK